MLVWPIASRIARSPPPAINQTAGERLPKVVPGEAFDSARGELDHSWEIKLHFIYITPAPVFAWLDGLDDRVLGGVEVFRRVLVLGGITATDMATRHAEPQMNPSVAHFQALPTNTNVRFHVFDLIQVRAFLHMLTP
jgi:hypothetical protein